VSKNLPLFQDVTIGNLVEVEKNRWIIRIFTFPEKLINTNKNKIIDTNFSFKDNVSLKINAYNFLKKFLFIKGLIISLKKDFRNG